MSLLGVLRRLVDNFTSLAAPPTFSLLLPSSPRSPRSSFEQLPNELIQSIVEYVGPPVWDQSANGERIRNLSSLSLVSKRLLPFAQTLLFSVLKIRPYSSSLLLTAHASDPRCRELASKTRLVLCDTRKCTVTEAEKEFKLEAFRSLVVEAPNLREALSISSRSSPETFFDGTGGHFYCSCKTQLVTDKATAVALKRLHLCSDPFLELQSVSLPQLTHLSLRRQRISPRGIKTNQLPSLRHLVWSGDDTIDEGVIATIETFDRQFDSLTFPIEHLPQFLERLPRFPIARVLIDTGNWTDDELFEPHRNTIVHLRIESYLFSSWIGDISDSAAEPLETEIEALEALITMIQSTRPSSPLRSIYIEAKGKVNPTRFTAAARRLEADLSEFCQTRGIVLVHEAQPESGWYSRISEDFTRRMGLNRREKLDNVD